MKKALITGITGQDGSYLADLLLSKGYEVHGIFRRSSSFNTGRISHLQDPDNDIEKVTMHYGDLTDSSSLIHIIDKIRPDEVYNLASQSHVRISFDIPEYTGDVTGLGTTRLLEAIRIIGKNKIKYYQASSSEMFGKVSEIPQKETTPFYPRSPYGAAKLYSYWMTVNYRESYGMFASNGILFNHESPRRGANFVTRKITIELAHILAGDTHSIRLGNLNSKRDWGYAPEFAEAMWRILQAKKPDDFVIATGETHTVKEFVKECFALVNLDWKDFIVVDPQYYRPAEVDILLGDSSKAKRILKWKPKVTFKELVKIMLEADCAQIIGPNWKEMLPELRGKLKKRSSK